MQKGIWACLVRTTHSVMPAVILVSAMGLVETVIAQTEVVPVAKEKKTVEPVFRVSKLAEQDVEKGKAKIQEATPVAADTDNSASKNQPMNRVASNNIPAGLPAATLSAKNLPPNILDAPATANSLPAASVSHSKAAVTPTRAPHPLDRAVKDARTSLDDMRTDVLDYTALMAKREQVKGVVGSPSYMAIKVRCPRTLADGTKVPFSIYMKFLRPKQSAGREVIWVQGQNDGKLVVHESGGLIGLRRIYLDPTGWIAMKGQRYPIYEAGLENLIVKLIEKAERDRDAGPCLVSYKEGANVNKRSCSMIELTHNERRAPYEFHQAKVFIDDELKLPVRFAAYDWPTSPTEKPKLLEEYTYYNIKVNVGLSDIDFSPENPAYKFPRR